MQANSQSLKPATTARQAFTLIELLVSMAVLSLLMVMVFSMVDQTQKTWNVARSRVSQFREARVAFEAVTRSLRQATLNPYWDYDYGNWRYTTDQKNPTVPQGYQRQSELHFISGPSIDILDVPGSERRPGHAIFFQIPGGFGAQEENAQFSDLLNARGFFVEYGEDSAFKPAFLNTETNPRYRFRLMELRPPTESLLIYLHDLKAEGAKGIGASETQLRKWFTTQMQGEFEGGTMVRPIADNILAAFFLPKFPETDDRNFVLAPDYIYDSRAWQYGNKSPQAEFSKNQLPPLIEVTMVAVDEKSMIRYQQQNPGQKTDMPDFVPNSLFKRFNNYRSFLDDLEALKTALDAKKIDFRVFNQTVPMRGSGWSLAS
jgi:uncharacterized protein (TIGR02599 family)